ncbi:MAG: hypothetical protein DME26_00400 [Verrucomicrobia bacterium]|nr:MAG: hypothetical protein DME26_00400 [Verrucomicrobiota bacterium]
MDGVRQDFIIEQRPVGAGPLRIELAVAGAKVKPMADGARLVLEKSGREIASWRCKVAQICNLLYRGFATRRWMTRHNVLELATLCRLEIGDTAGWKPALHPRKRLCAALPCSPCW